jgi:hypothetical protein
MPALSVAIDGVTLATVSMDGYDVMSVRAGGTRIDDDLATLDLSGGSYPEVGESTYLTWISDIPLQTGQVVTVTFLETASSSHAGKTIEELFPDESSSTQTDFKPTAEMFAELRAMPTLRDKFAFRLVSSSGTNFAGKTARDEHGFGFTVLWDSSNPERARVSLHSYTLNNLEARGPMNNHVEEKLNYGGWVRFELVA